MKPNILFIISDEQSPLTVRCYGAEFMRTPNIDRLARQGTLFEHAYCAFPLCVPGRNSLMTGLQCHKIKAYDIGSPLALDLPTWAHMLARAGYRTPLYGKMHFLGADQLHGFDEHKHEMQHQIDGFRWGEEVGNGTAYSTFTKIHFTDSLKTVGRTDYNYTCDTGSRDSAVGLQILEDHPIAREWRALRPERSRGGEEVAADPAHAAMLCELRARLDRGMQETNDPVLTGRIEPKPGMLVNSGDKDLPHGQTVPAASIIVER